ncbi:hypothetical protein E1B28_007363 [Marasmius oreades]|uniref:Uncharacterized protein n=1 Tax=Marasmius oreades TaxID=181124 RepID=A0A9P7UVR4_9AGAR|nr:uncharacterized protein E1B28_007363 [Marasmius oreades]KAG7093709.1 hypothetical protein E1B28_007363 [Marasmius oreades]
MAISSMPAMNQQRRPTLPSLHSLDLPTLSPAIPRPSTSPYALYDNGRHSQPQPQRPRQRQFSTSSSRTPSPSLSESTDRQKTFMTAVASTFPPHLLPQSKGPDLRLIPCSSVDDADAVVFVPPRSLTLPAEQNQALLLVGPALSQFRHPQRQIAKGARIHPYKFARSNDRTQMRRVSSSSSVTTVSSTATC